MKRLIPALLLTLVLTLAACGGSTGTTGNSTGGSNNGASQQGITGASSYLSCPQSTNTTAQPKPTGTVTLTVSGAPSSPAEDALDRQNLDNFMKLHPNIKINWAPISGDYEVRMRADVASNTLPDVFYLSPDMSSSYISSGKLLNLSPYMAKSNVSPNSYYSSLLSPFICTKGQVFGLPKDWDSLGVFYNKQMFQAAGLSAPSANWTWSDMQADAKKLTKNPGAPNSVYGVSLSADASRWGAFLLANGGSVLNKDGTQATFTDSAAVKSLQFYDSFIQTKTGTLPTSVGAPWNGDAFGKQRVAMAIEGGWLIPYMAQQYSSVQYGIAPLPIAPTGKRANLIFTNAWAASANTKQPEAAWELIQYMTGATVQENQLNAGFALPTIKGLENAPYFASHPDFKNLFNAASYSYADYYGPQDSDVHNDLATALQQVMINNRNPQDALNDAAKKLDNQLQD